MEFHAEVLFVFLPWFVFIFLGFVCTKLVSWAQNRKAGAIVFGVIVQMFLPDPYVQRTVETVITEKKKHIKAQKESEPYLKE